MQPLPITFKSRETKYYPCFGPLGISGLWLSVQYPLDCRFLVGDALWHRYDRIERLGTDTWLSSLQCCRRGLIIALSDKWTSVDCGRIRLNREISVAWTQDPYHQEFSGNGLQLHLQLDVFPTAAGNWRFFAPSAVYTLYQDPERLNFLTALSEERFAYPLIMAYNDFLRIAICISRVSLPKFDEAPIRPHKEHRYLQKTDIGSLGFSLSEEQVSLHAYWPYYEGDRSVALDSQWSPASAFYPLSGSNFSVSLSYEILVFEADTFSDAAFLAFKNAASLANPVPVQLPFSLEEARKYRIAALQKTYREWGEDGAGFFFNFDPTRGYDAPPRAFGTSFKAWDTRRCGDLLEYGFTGRQLNAAYILAEACRGEWIDRGRRVVDFFVRNCTVPTGWLYTIYDVSKRRPIYTIGDPQGPVLHYSDLFPKPANYLRSMTEAAFDLLLNYQLHHALGQTAERWLEICRRFADFLIEHQNADGSWYRAYTPEGEPVSSAVWAHRSEFAMKSATAIPIPYLIAFSEVQENSIDQYIAAARRAGLYLLQHNIAYDHYEGGTLDNPNVIDKEAALYTMTALLSLYDCLQERSFLDGALRAAKLAITWNYLWDVPFPPGTPLYQASFRSSGWGGINCVWGGGVVDIYSLFSLRDFYRLYELTGEAFFMRLAELIAYGTQQCLSYPGNLMWFTDIGMQPEGIALSNQGADEGLITKGSFWGSFGWIYSAGIFGLDNYLREKKLMK